MRWIKIEPGCILPEKDEDVLIKNEDAKKAVCATFNGSRFERYNCYHPDDRCIAFYYSPTHWMVMPSIKYPKHRL